MSEVNLGRMTWVPELLGGVEKRGGGIPEGGVTATGVYDPAGADNAIRFVAKLVGSLGNAITINFVIDGPNSPLYVTVSGTTITVHLASDGSGNSTSTAAEVVAAINGTIASHLLVQASLYPQGSSGAGIVLVGSVTLSGGGATPPASPNTAGDGGVDFTARGASLKTQVGQQANNFGLYLGESNGSSSRLQFVDGTTAATTAITTEAFPMEGLAFDPTDGSLYAVTTFGNTHLYRIDPATGTAVDIGLIGNDTTTDFYDISFDPSGQLYGKNASFNRLCTIDKATAQRTVIDSNTPSQHQTAFEIDGNTGVAYAARRNNSDLYQVNLSNGNISTVVTLNGGPASAGNGSITGMTIRADGTLYAVMLETVGLVTTTWLVTINRSTGLITNVGTLPSIPTFTNGWSALAAWPRTHAQLIGDRRGIGITDLNASGHSNFYIRTGKGVAAFTGGASNEKSTSKFGKGVSPFTGSGASEGGSGAPIPDGVYIAHSSYNSGDPTLGWTKMYRIDLSTSTRTLIGVTRLTGTSTYMGLTALAVTQDGTKLFGIVDDNGRGDNPTYTNANWLVRVDPDTAELTLINPIMDGATQMYLYDATFTSDGFLWGYHQGGLSGDRKLVKVDVSDGSATRIGSADGTVYGGGIAADQSDVVYYMGHGNGGVLQTVNTTTGARTTIATLDQSSGDDIAAADWSWDGKLYVVDWRQTGSSPNFAQHIESVNTSTGHLTDVATSLLDQMPAAGGQNEYLDALAIWPKDKATVLGSRTGRGITDFNATAAREGGTVVQSDWYASKAGPNTSSQLYTLDMTTGTLTAIGSMGVAMTGLAFDPTDGTLYGVTSGNSTNSRKLYTVDTSTGAATLVGSLSDGTDTWIVADIACDSAGNLYGLPGTSPYKLLSINKSTGAAAGIGTLGYTVFGGACAFDGSDVLYATARGAGGFVDTINTSTGAVTTGATLDGGTVGGSLNAAAFGLAGSFTGYVALESNSSTDTRVLGVDLSTGVTTHICTTDARVDAIAVPP